MRAVPHPPVTIVILNWNNAADTRSCLAALRAQTYPNARVLVLDNGSTDGSAQALAPTDASYDFLALPRNTGFTGGCNAAMAHAFAHGAAYVWLLNNDALAEPDTLATLVRAAEADPAIGLASPVIIPRPGTTEIDVAAARFDRATLAYTSTADLATARRWHAETPTSIVPHGTALLVRDALWHRIGGLDDRFFAYWEDIDYALRSAAAGFRNITAFDCAIAHPPKPMLSEPLALKPHVYYYQARNELLLWQKLAPLPRLLKPRWWHLRRYLRQLALLRPAPASAEALLAGLWHGWRGISGERPAGRMPSPLRWLLTRAAAILHP